MSSTGTKRQTAEERRHDVILAAIQEFATFGYHGGSTERIAKAAGISQPYVLRLFGTKKSLFIAALERVCDDIVEAWDQSLQDYLKSDAGPDTPAARIAALRTPFLRFVEDVIEVRLVLQASAASEDTEIRHALKRGMARMFNWVREATGESYEVVQTFWAHGMMLMIAASIRALDDSRDAEWARAMLMLPASRQDQM